MRQYGYDVWDHGAQKGVYQPPLCVKWRGRWYRTLPMTAPAGEPALSALALEKIRAFGRIAFGMRACLDNLERTGRKFSELPMFDTKQHLHVQ